MMFKRSSYFALKNVLKEQGVAVSEPLFHATSFTNAPSIIQTGFKARAGGPHNSGYYDNAVCFSRNLNYILKGLFGGAQVIFIVDRRELKAAGFKTYAFDYNFIRYAFGKDPSFKKYLSAAKNKGNAFEFEERISRSKPYTKKLQEWEDQGKDFDDLEAELFAQPETVIPHRFIKALVVLGEVTGPAYNQADAYSLTRNNQKLYRPHMQLEKLCLDHDIPVIHYKIDLVDKNKTSYKPSLVDPYDYKKLLTSEMAHEDIEPDWGVYGKNYYIGFIFKNLKSSLADQLGPEDLPQVFIDSPVNPANIIYQGHKGKLAIYVFSGSQEEIAEAGSILTKCVKNPRSIWRDIKDFMKTKEPLPF